MLKKPAKKVFLAPNRSPRSNYAEGLRVTTSTRTLLTRFFFSGRRISLMMSRMRATASNLLFCFLLFRRIGTPPLALKRVWKSASVREELLIWACRDLKITPERDRRSIFLPLPLSIFLALLDPRRLFALPCKHDWGSLPPRRPLFMLRSTRGCTIRRWTRCPVCGPIRSNH